MKTELYKAARAIDQMMIRGFGCMDRTLSTNVCLRVVCAKGREQKPYNIKRKAASSKYITIY